MYRRALQALHNAAVPFVIAGAYAIYEHTGIYRQTKDLDLFFEPSAVVSADIGGHGSPGSLASASRSHQLRPSSGGTATGSGMRILSGSKVAGPILPHAHLCRVTNRWTEWSSTRRR